MLITNTNKKILKIQKNMYKDVCVAYVMSTKYIISIRQ